MDVCKKGLALYPFCSRFAENDVLVSTKGYVKFSFRYLSPIISRQTNGKGIPTLFYV